MANSLFRKHLHNLFYGAAMGKITFILVSLFMLFSIDSEAQNRFKVSDGVYIATYGNVSVIENDNTKQSIQIKVEKKSDDLYDIFCNNKYVKSATKRVLKETINLAITSSTGGAGILTRVAIEVGVDYIYDSVCEYYK